MKKLSSLFIFLFIISFSQAQEMEEYIVEGTVTTISKDSIITVKITDGDVMPATGQEVSVSKKIVMGNSRITMGVANGRIISVLNGILKFQVTKYTSSMTDANGARIPLIKVENTAELKWKMKPIPTYSSEYKRAEQMVEEKNYEAAIPLLDSLTKVKPESYVFYQRGFCRYKLKQYNESIEDFTATLELSPDYQMALYMRAQAKGGLEKYEEGIVDLEKLMALELDRDSEEIVLKEHMYFMNQTDARTNKELLCKDSKRLYEIDRYNKEYYDNKNYYCGVYPEMESGRCLPIAIASQTDQNYRIIAKTIKKSTYPFLKSKSVQKTIEVGTYAKLYTFTKDFSMSAAVVKITKVEGAYIEFMVEYWAVRMNNKPYVEEFPRDKEMILIW